MLISIAPFIAFQGSHSLLALLPQHKARANRIYGPSLSQFIHCPDHKGESCWYRERKVASWASQFIRSWTTVRECRHDKAPCHIRTRCDAMLRWNTVGHVSDSEEQIGNAEVSNDCTGVNAEVRFVLSLVSKKLSPAWIIIWDAGRGSTTPTVVLGWLRETLKQGLGSAPLSVMQKWGSS